MADIKADYERLGQISSRFSQRAEELQTTLKNLEARVDNLRGGGWLGAGAKAFYNEMDNDLIPALVRLHQAIEDANQVTHKIEDEFRKAEDDACTCVRFEPQ